MFLILKSILLTSITLLFTQNCSFAQDLFSINKPERIFLKLFDITGNEAQCLIDEYILPGEYSVEFCSNSLKKGILYRLQNSNGFICKKMIVL